MSLRNTDGIAIKSVISRFMNSFDLKDWAGMAALLHDTLQLDYTDLRGEAPKEVSSAEYVASRKEALESLLTHHLISNFDVTLENNLATVTASCLIYRKRGEDVFNSHALYTFGLVSSTGGWKISDITQRILWNEGEPNLHSGVN